MERADLDKYNIPVAQKEAFMALYNTWKTTNKQVSWNNISPAPHSLMLSYSDLPQYNEEDVRKLLNRLVIVKLNGGLGTTMNCSGPKSCLTLRENTAFLDAIIMQVNELNTKFNVDLPLVLMNSFRTEKETEDRIKYLKSKGITCSIHSFLQSSYVRLDAETLKPIPAEVSDAFYPPGHGDIINGAFLDSGLPQKFLDQGKDIIFISNSDNLGAVPDLKILSFFADSKKEFITEQAIKTKNDLKGGTLVLNDNELELLELAMVPSDHISDFEDISLFKTFNTNNIWIKSEALIKKGKTDIIKSIITNYKVVPVDSKPTRVIQLETAMGSAVSIFDSVAVVVERGRFLPVKKWQDVLLLSSDIFTFKNGFLKCQLPECPEIRLSDEYDSLESFGKYFKSIPSLIKCKKLVVAGAVEFEEDVVLVDNVEIIGSGKICSGVYSGKIELNA